MAMVVSGEVVKRRRWWRCLLALAAGFCWCNKGQTTHTIRGLKNDMR